MKTTKEFRKNLKDRILTEEMLGSAIYSVNKRAKNMRDQQEYYRIKRLNDPDWYDKFHNEKKYKRKKQEYYRKKEKLLSVLVPACIHVDDNNNYFLYYQCGEFSFHKPIQKSQCSKYNLEIIQIKDFYTFGKDIHELLSVQFVDKILRLIDEGDYVLLNEEKES